MGHVTEQTASVNAKLNALAVVNSYDEKDVADSANILLQDKWRTFFSKFDVQDGQISVDDFRDSHFRSEFDVSRLEAMEEKERKERTRHNSLLQLDKLSIKRTASFERALNCNHQITGDSQIYTRTANLHRDNRKSCFSGFVAKISSDYLVDENSRCFFRNRYRCFPPPVFVPFVVILEIVCYLYYAIKEGSFKLSGSVPNQSFLLYTPDRRQELWRFVFYMFLHAGWIHLSFNFLVQILVGIPLEMVHGSTRICLVYMSGILASSLATSVFDKSACLAGSAGGVYAILAAHLANILTNYSEVEIGFVKLAAIFITSSTDVGLAVWDRYSTSNSPPVGYAGHLMGSFIGLTIGFLIIRSFGQSLRSQILCWVALIVYGALTVIAIFWNIFAY
ncbi:DgyrCDS11968 [Dimorphilus gyrociliatus]|uniref:DgyrCDS11968 n=1 Tax=Dimorphilus gyrociliatus TaxID=2664684 RepID=A0A7I8W8E8_9ANNE|nr:DgyrCDS11968 [Dimorphilus gyrociliatus]